VENLRFYHSEAVSSCEVKETVKKSHNGKIQVGKIIPTKPEDIRVKKFCPWDCSENNFCEWYLHYLWWDNCLGEKDGLCKS
jgi:hypothetical protein